MTYGLMSNYVERTLWRGACQCSSLCALVGALASTRVNARVGAPVDAPAGASPGRPRRSLSFRPGAGADRSALLGAPCSVSLALPPPANTIYIYIYGISL